LGLFSGMGALEYGFRLAGHDVVVSNEVDPTICSTLRKNFDQEVLETSIHRLSIEKLRKDFGQIECVVGGFPCPIYSRAADIHSTRVGVRSSNPYATYARLGGDLFLHFWRAVAILQPDVFVVENVPGLLGASIVRETFRNTPCNRNNLGYYYTLYEGILNARDFGLPQERKRYFFVGTVKQADPMSQEEVHSLFMEIGKVMTKRLLVVNDILEADPDIAMPAYGWRRYYGQTCRDRPIVTEAGPDAVAPTCVAHYAKDRSTRLVKVDGKVRPYTTLEYARLQGIPDNVELQGSTSYRYIQSGNAVAVPVAKALATGIKRLVN